MVKIREERTEDLLAVQTVNERAFGQQTEADLVAKLRHNCDQVLSLVALVHDEVVGHILFSPATIEGDRRIVKGMALAPMAVLPEYQRQGVGSELVRSAIRNLKQRNCPFIVVLGHPEYYPRFGFEPASRYGIRSQWEVPDDAFMIMLLDEKGMKTVSGVARYRPEFAAMM